MDNSISLAMAADVSQLQARIKELEASLEHQKKLSDELQTALLFDTVKQNAKQKRNKYRKDTPLKTYIKNNWNNGEIRMKLAESLGVSVGNVPKTMLRSYLSIKYKNISNPDPVEPKAKKQKKLIVQSDSESNPTSAPAPQDIKKVDEKEYEIKKEKENEKESDNDNEDEVLPSLKSPGLEDLRLSDGTSISDWW